MTFLKSKQKSVEQAIISQLKNEIDTATLFVKKIEEGGLDTSYPDIDESSIDKESLSGALISMRDQLKSLKEVELQRKWVSDGLAEFVEILRLQQSDLETTCQQLISRLIKYIDANQGSIYITDFDKEVLEQIACYAYDRKKFHEKTFGFGEGLVGQVFLEKETQLLAQLPDNYIKITSGLGEALPKNLIIVPLKSNEEVLGIIELASFKEIEPFQVEFLEKLGENIASSIAAIKTNEKTKKLLDISRQQTEELRAQEEEMQQNLEEMQATQEELARKEAESSSVLTALNKACYVAELNKEGQILNSQGRLAALLTDVFQQGTLEGKQYSDFISSASISLENILVDVTEGKSATRTVSIKAAKQETCLYEVFSPIFDNQGKIIKLLVIATDITEQKKMEEEMKQIREKEKARAEHNNKAQTKMMENFIKKSKEKEQQLLQRIKELEASATNNK